MQLQQLVPCYPFNVPELRHGPSVDQRLGVGALERMNHPRFCSVLRNPASRIIVRHGERFEAERHPTCDFGDAADPQHRRSTPNASACSSSHVWSNVKQAVSKTPDRRLFAKPMTPERASSLPTDAVPAEQVDAFVARFAGLQDTLADKLLPALLRWLGERPPLHRQPECRRATKAGCCS